MASTADPEPDGHQRTPIPASDSTDLARPPFEGLVAPAPLAPDPPPVARFGAFAAIAVGGLLGFGIGYGIGDLMGSSSTWAAVGAIVGAITGSVGVGVVANLTLRAMGEWNEVEHPERSHQSEDRQ